MKAQLIENQTKKREYPYLVKHVPTGIIVLASGHRGIFCGSMGTILIEGTDGREKGTFNDGWTFDDGKSCEGWRILEKGEKVILEND